MENLGTMFVCMVRDIRPPHTPTKEAKHMGLKNKK